MYNRLLFILVLALFLDAQCSGAETVCLNMIVKNESAVIRRCLTSAKPLIDYWVIVDTGSTDGTQDIIKEFMKDIPGELHERPWVNFGHNRNEALALAKGKADYVLIIDADEVFSYPEGFKWPQLDKDFYHITTEFSGTQYGRVQLIKNALNWEWKGVLHEALSANNAFTSASLEGIQDVVRTDGARSQDPRKFHKDAEILEIALRSEPTNTRYQFYLAQSYRDAQEHEKALLNYQKRIAMGGWDQEIFWSMLQVGALQEALKMSPEVIHESYTKAFNYRPSRIEPLHRLTYYYRTAEQYEKGYQAALPALNVPLSNDVLFVEHWVYDYGLLLEYSICAYWTGRYLEAFLASQLILARPNIPTHVRECVERNLVWVNMKLKELHPIAK